VVVEVTDYYAVTAKEAPKPEARRSSNEHRQRDGTNRYLEAQLPPMNFSTPVADN
jgi:hypothetical protein